MNEKRYARLVKKLIQSVLYSVICFAPITAIFASVQSVQGFNITEHSGFLSFRYLYDDYRESNLGDTAQHDTRPTYQQEFNINAKGYVYHPNLLSLEMGTSLILDQSRFESDQGNSETNEELIGLNLQMDFLKKKPYPFSIYYNKTNPSVSTGLSGRFIQENTSYGLNFSLLNPITPVQVEFSSSVENSEGKGSDQVVDDHREQAELKFNYPYGSGNHAQLTFQQNSIDSQSGNPDLPIIQHISTTNTVSLDTRNIFGDKKQFILTSVLSNRERDDDPFEKEMTFSPRVNWTHSETLSSYYFLNYTNYSLDYADVLENDLESEQKQVNIGLSHKSENMTSGVRLLVENTASSEFDYDNTSLNYDISRQFSFESSVVQLSYKGNYDVRDQKSSTNEYAVFGEQHTLEGTTPVDLLRFNIVITSVEVWNENRTQQFVENIDYRLIQIGDQLQLQRLVGGAILDGQIVLVDYDYQTGGTFAYNILVHNVTASWNIDKHYELYTRYRQTDQELDEGILNNISLNDLESVSYGVKVDKPLLNGMLIGAEYYNEDVQNLDQLGNDISSYKKDNLNYYFELPLSKQTDIRFSGRRVIKDFQSSDEDSDLEGYILRIKSRPALRVTSSLESSYEKDTGGTMVREQTRHRLLVRWKMRQLQFSASVLYADEKLGPDQRDRWEAKAELRRDFF